MAKVYLDTNYFIDAVHRKPELFLLDSLEKNVVCISILSVHIYCYSYKIKIPDSRLVRQLEKFQLIFLTEEISEKALTGPTSDLEDNIQLHSAADADCDIFLTADTKLLKMKFFGKAKIASEMG